MDKIKNELMDEVTEEVTAPRKNPFCVVSKGTFGEYNVHDIQTNSAWIENPYGDTYAVVPDSMVPDMVATSGFCEIVLNEDETEVVSFTALDIPEVPEPEEPAQENDAWDEMAEAIKEGVNEV